MVTFKITKTKKSIPNCKKNAGPYFMGNVMSSTGRHYDVEVTPWEIGFYKFLKKDGIKTFYNTSIARISANCKETKEDVYYVRYGWEGDSPKDPEMKALIRFLVKEFGRKPIVKGAKPKTVPLSQYYKQMYSKR